MRLVSFLSVTFLFVYGLVTNAHHFNAGQVFSINIENMRYGLAPQPVLATTALDNFVIQLKKDEETERTRAIEKWKAKTEAQYVQKGMLTLMSQFPSSYSCQQGKQVLQTRWEKAKERTLVDVRSWVNYIKQRHCYELIRYTKLFSDDGLRQYRQSIKASPYLALETNSLASSMELK